MERADHVLTMRNGTIVNEVATEVKSHKSQKSTSVSPVAQEWKRQTDGNVATLNGVEKRNGGGDYALEEDEKVAGPVPWGVYWRYFRAGMSTPVILIVFLLYIATQGEASTAFIGASFPSNCSAIVHRPNHRAVAAFKRGSVLRLCC